MATKLIENKLDYAVVVIVAFFLATFIGGMALGMRKPVSDGTATAEQATTQPQTQQAPQASEPAVETPVTATPESQQAQPEKPQKQEDIKKNEQEDDD